MTSRKAPASIPAAWLRPMPPGQKIPVWRWILLPAATWLLHRSRRTWLNGELSLQTDEIRFVKTMMKKSSPTATPEWSIPLSGITDVTMKKGMASETIEIHHSAGIAKLMSLRSADFIARLNEASSRARQKTVSDETV